ncbi:MAG: hypothetical protein VX892_03840 [Candidatus Thermoplasmatota archaeon]|nr:hypothetical protein [Candidatus Thermoplasmatota archaeon]
MSRVAPRVGFFASGVSVLLILSLLLNSWLGLFPAVISGVVPMKFHLHYYIANLLGLEFSAAAYSESGVITLQENVQLILLPISLTAARVGLRKRPVFEMPKTASLSEQAEAMEAGTVAKVEQLNQSSSIRILLSRVILLGASLLFVLNSMLGILPGFLFDQGGMKIHPIYALFRLLGMDPSGPTWSQASMIGTQEIIMIWIMVFLTPVAFSIRPKPAKSEQPPSELPPVGRSNDRVINPLAAEVIASVLGEAQRVDSETVDSALGEMDKLVELGVTSSSSGIMANIEENEDAEESSDPEFVIEAPKEEAKLHLDKDDVNAIEKDIHEEFIPDASTLLGIESPNENSSESTLENESLLGAEEKSPTVEEEVQDVEISQDEETESSIEEPEEKEVDISEDEVSESEILDQEIEDSSSPIKATPSITGEMPVRPTSLPATAELDPKTGRWMINGVPVGPKVTATGLDSDSGNLRIGGDDPLKQSKKNEDVSTPKSPERKGEKRGQKIEAPEPEVSPQRRTKDGQKEHEPLPDMPEMTGRPNAEKPKERKDDVELPDMPKF